MNPFELAEKLLDLTGTYTCLIEGFNPRRYIGKPGKFLADILIRNSELRENIHNLRAEHFNHPWFAKIVAGVEDWLTIARRGADKEQQRIIDKIRGK